MVLPAVIAALGTAAASMANNAINNSRIDKENKKIDDAISALKYNPEDYYTNYSYYDDPTLYDTYQLQGTEYDNVSLDPSVLAAQNQALEDLINLSEAKGLNAIDQQALQEIVNEENKNLQGQNDAILQDAMQRGVYGSGLEMAQRLQNAQSSANRMSNRDMDVMSQAQQRALDALSSYGNLASNMRSQDYNEQARRAAAQDAINQANWENRQKVSNSNVDLRNDVNMKNTDIYNKQQDSNVQSAKDIYANDENKVALRTGQYGGNKEDIRKRQEQNQQMIGNLGTAIGSALSSSK